MKKASLVLILIVAAIGTLVMVNVATDTTAVTSKANRDASDPFVTLSEFETTFSQAPCDLCKSFTCPSPSCGDFDHACKCQTCNGTYNCWRH